MRKFINEITIDELKVKQKNKYYLDIICVCIGIIYLVGALFFTQSIFLFITGIALLLLAAIPNNTSIMIYLKEKEGEK
jgi:hypothetical protein